MAHEDLFPFLGKSVLLEKQFNVRLLDPYQCQINIWSCSLKNGLCYCHRLLEISFWGGFIALEKGVHFLFCLTWIKVENLSQFCCWSGWTFGNMKSFSLHCPRQRHKCSSDKQSLFMSKEHLFLGKNGLFVSEKEAHLFSDVFSPLLGELRFSCSVCFHTEEWILDVQSHCCMASTLGAVCYTIFWHRTA